MTDSTCWIDYSADRRTCRRNTQGWYEITCADNTLRFAGPGPKNAYWPVLLRKWAEQNNLAPSIEYGADGSEITRVSVTKAQVQSFIAYLYDDEPAYNDPARMLLWKGHAWAVHYLIDLKAFVAQEFSERAQFTLFADVW